MDEDFPILAIVAMNPAHPYAVLDHLASAGVPVARSTLYRRMDALVRQGLLNERARRFASGHLGRRLSLTAKGRRRLMDEAMAVLQHEPLESPRFALALRYAGGAAEETTLEILRDRMAQAARELTREEMLAGDTAGWARAIADRRVVHLKADITWLQAALARRPSQRRAG